MHRLVLLLPLLVAGAAPSPCSPQEASQAPRSAPELTRANLDALLQLVLPEPVELEWDAIGWRPSLALAVREARAEQKPVLLWAMNGHPLGCV